MTAVQTHALDQSGTVDRITKQVAQTVVSVPLLAGEALETGLSLISLARAARIPLDTAVAYERVGRQMISAAMAAVKNAESPPEKTRGIGGVL